MATRRRSQADAITRQVALLRGINVGGKHLVPMAVLRGLAEGLGLSDVDTYIQSGNLLFSAPLTAPAVLERALQRRFGFAVPVVVLPLADVSSMSPPASLREAAAQRPQLLHAGFSQRSVDAGVAAALTAQGRAGELAIADDRGVLWIDYAGGAGRSRLTPSVIDHFVGAPTTLRSWRTVQAIAARA